MQSDILPDSRSATTKGAVASVHGYWVPIFCANCGCDGGIVPEENMNFVFYLCDPCGEKYGVIADTYMEPDAMFWQKVHEAQIEKYGRVLLPHELAVAVEEAHSPLATLARDHHHSLRG